MSVKNNLLILSYCPTNINTKVRMFVCLWLNHVEPISFYTFFIFISLKGLLNNLFMTALTK